jgi:serine/threonine protein kinase
VCDFGTSRLLTAHRPLLRETSFTGGTSAQDMASLTATMTMGVGTLLWMAPELFLRGGTKYGPEVDVYVAVGHPHASTKTAANIGSVTLDLARLLAGTATG